LSTSKKLNFRESFLRLMKTFPRKALDISALMLLVVSVAGAQNTASISGTVRDTAEALVPGLR